MASLVSHHDDPRHQHYQEEEEEGEICSICLGTLPRWASEFLRFTCCGKGIHKECDAQLLKSACSQNCPMCRAPNASLEEQHKRSLRWAKKSKAWAMFGVGCDFQCGRGVSESKEMARLWYEKAAEQGYVDAQYILSVMHAKGEGGLPVSMEKARLWCEKAAEQGHPKAQFGLGFRLGFMHYSGEGGLPVSKEKARLWYEKAAEQGHSNAQFALDLMHDNGEDGLPLSMEKARLWCEKAAEQGHPMAQYNLSVMHAKGEGGPVSKEHCFFWLGRVDEKGYEKATPFLDGLKSCCFSCGKTGNMKLKCCARCKCAYYCSRECQVAAWNGGHKAACKQIRRKQQSAKSSQ
jgi:hypothetical protein